MTALTQASTLRRILRGGQIRSVYQPIVDLDTGAVVGYEGLARGPVGSPLERPDLLFAAAHAEGFVEELEWACPTAALQGALDDVGADRRSLALMPFVAPEVIKLDLQLVQENPSPAIAAIVHAVNAEAERSGALLLAEGIETEEQLEVARALGARYGQGWLFGRPGPLDATTPATRLCAHLSTRPAPQSPFDAVAAHLRPRRGTKRLLLAISKHLEAQVAAQGDAAVVLAAFQEARHFTPRSAARYERLANHAALVGALGIGLTEEPAPGVRGASLDATDDLAGEWNVVVIAPHFAAAFVARDLGDSPRNDMARRFDFCLTYDRDLAVEAARGLLARIAPR